MVSKFIDYLKDEGIINSSIIIKNYLLREIQKRFLSHDGLIIKRVHGSKMYLDLSYPGISRDLSLYGTREKLEVEILKNELKKDMIVLDIGANIGYYTLLEASIVGEKGRIYALEPEPRNFELLTKNIKLNNNYSEIVETYPYAVSDKSGTSKLYLSEFSNLHTMVGANNDNMLKKNEENPKFAEVKTVQIDDFLVGKESVDFIRMDIEGYECEAIDGMLRTLEKTQTPIKLLIEVHPSLYNEVDRNFKTRLRKLKDIGFKAKYIVSAGVAQPQKIIDLGYKPQKSIREGKFYRGLYKDFAMDDLIDLIHFLPKIIRAILLTKSN